MTPPVRLLAVGGFVGPAAFVGAWAIAGTATPGYSPVQGAISDLAAVGASTRVVMTLGFVGFSLGVIAFGFALRPALAGGAWIAAVATGCCTLGVAACPLGGWAGDATHATFAGLGYAAIVALQVLAAVAIARAGRPAWARFSLLTGGLAAGFLMASTLGPAHGLWQRLGLTVSDGWIVAAAAAIRANYAGRPIDPAG